MALYKVKRQLYVETDVLGVGLGESLLQVRDGMHFRMNEAANNAAPWPVAFTSKSFKKCENLM